MVKGNRYIDYSGSIHVLTSSAKCFLAWARLLRAASSWPRLRCSRDLSQGSQSGVWSTDHWAWERYCSASRSLPSPGRGGEGRGGEGRGGEGRGGEGRGGEGRGGEVRGEEGREGEGRVGEGRGGEEGTMNIAMFWWLMMLPICTYGSFGQNEVGGGELDVGSPVDLRQELEGL